MTRLQELLLARLNAARFDLDEVFARLEGIDLEWGPTTGMRTIGGQLMEIAATEDAVMERVISGRSDTRFQDNEARCTRESLAGYREVLDRVRGRTIEYVKATSDDVLNAETELFKGWKEMMGLSSIPVAEGIRTIAQHEAYHTGQLVSYMWSRGDDPYEW